MIAAVNSGFQVTGSASAVLFGLVLVSTTFGYNAALSRLDDLSDYKHFINWFWSAGFAICIYFAYCFIISVHAFESRYSYPNLVALTLGTWVVLLGLHAYETNWLYRVSQTDWLWFKNIFRDETIVIAIVFGIFTLLTFWALFFTSTDAGRYQMLFTAVRYTLMLAAIRAVFLVRFTFGVLMELTNAEKRKATEADEAPRNPE
jgi:hypothetical protein